MSQANTTQTTLQFQMVQALQAQLATLNQLNVIMTQVNNSIVALTRAIVENTRMMSKIAISKSGFAAEQKMLSTGFLSLSNTQRGALNSVGNQFVNLDTSLNNIVSGLQILEKPLPLGPQGSSPTEGGPTTRGYKGQIETEVLDNIKSLFGKGQFSGMKDFFTPIKDILSGTVNLGKGWVEMFTAGRGKPFDQDQWIGGGVKASGGLESVFGGLKQGFLNFFGKDGVVGKGLQNTGKAFNPMLSAFGQMGPQMLAMSLVMQPVTEFLGALLEPLSMISDYFAAFGSILSQALIPIMLQIQPIFDAFIPILQALVKPLGDVLLAIFNLSSIGILLQIITPLMPVITTLVTIFGTLLEAVTPLLTLFSNLIGIIMNSAFAKLGQIFQSMGITVESLTEGVRKFGVGVSNFTLMISGFFDFLAGKQTWAQYQEQGLAATGGGSDQKGWW